MARKIYISSDMSVDEELTDIAEVDPMIALLWPWILTAFDDWGRAEASPKRLKNLVFPANEAITIEIIKKALQLFNGRLITLYEINGKWYMYIDPEKWFRYQTHIRKEKREKDSSKIPAPPDEDDAHLRALARDDADERANLADCIPSPSPSLSPSPSKTYNDDDNNPFKLFEREGFGTLSQTIADQIGDFVDTYGARWTCEAMKRAVFYGKRTLAYVNSILMGWKAHGIDEPWTMDKPKEGGQANEKRRGVVKELRPGGNQETSGSDQGKTGVLPSKYAAEVARMSEVSG